MRQTLRHRRISIGVFCVFILFFTVNRIYDEGSDAEYDDLAEIGTDRNSKLNYGACRIWPGWNASDRGNLLYDEYRAKEAQLPSIGDASFLGNPNKCLRAGSRLDPYRIPSTDDHNWNEVQWGFVQKRCAAGNAHLYFDDLSTYSTHNYDIWRRPPSTTQAGTQTTTRGRAAIVLRTWDNYDYNDNRRAWLRALIAETALHSFGHYEVFLLVNVKNDTIELEEDQEAYEQALQAYVPEEFRDMALLWNKRTVEKWYPKVEEHGAQDQMYQALQIFSHQFQQFTHFWQLEMDLRFTGHVYDSLETAVGFADMQGRRNLWERNGRFYIPELYNGSYETFITAVDNEIGDTGVWGPARTTNFVPQGPEPPDRSEKHWGIDEDADVISLFPMVDPVGTDWIYENLLRNFADGPGTPRRAAFVSITRSSRRLLQLISEAQRENGQWIASEATLETFALLHGLKAVTIPHRITFTNDWTVQQFDENINRGPADNKAGGYEISSSYTAHGWVEGPWLQSSYWFRQNEADNQWRAYLAGDCMPPQLLHPIKDE